MNKIFIALLMSFLIFSSANAGTDDDNSLSKKNSGDVKECAEGFNKSMFALNKSLDDAIFEPVAKVYRKLPSEIRNGTSNALDNISNLLTIPNNILQGNIAEAGKNSARLIVNTTVGILGIFDVASELGVEKSGKEDYGQTLGVWGVGPGCYLVLPILGPSTARDAIGSFASLGTGLDPWYNITVRNDTHHFADFDYYSSRVSSALDFRAKNIESLDNLEKNSVNFYASVKSLYLQDKNKKISNSTSITETQNDSDWEEIETE